MILMPLGVGSPTGSNVLRAPNAGLLAGQGQPEQTLGRIGLPFRLPRPGSPEAARLPIPAGRIGSAAGGIGGESTVARMMAPRPVTPIVASTGTPPPAVMAQQVAPAGPQVNPPAPPAPSAMGGTGIAPTAQVPAASSAPAPIGQAVGAGRPTAPSLSSSPTSGSPSPWWGSRGGDVGDIGGIGSFAQPQYWWQSDTGGQTSTGVQKDTQTPTPGPKEKDNPEVTKGPEPGASSNIYD